MKIKPIIMMALALCLAFTFTACQGVQPAPEATQPAPETTPGVAEQPSGEHQGLFDNVAKAEANMGDEVKAAQMGFALRLLQTVNQDSEDKNVVISPQSISTALGMTYFGAQGETEEEMAKVLGISGLDTLTIASGYKHMAASLENSGDTEVQNANSVWVDEGFSVESGFINTMESAFLAAIKSIDLQGEDALDTVHGWIKENTSGMIEKLFEKPFSPDAVMVLCNAIYFDGKWTLPFDPESTSSADFHGKNGTTQVDMMFRDEDILGKDGQGYRSVMLPYGEDERFAMVAVLPEVDIDEFVAGLDNSQFAEMFKDYDEKEVAKLYLPKFTADKNLELNNVLKDMGMELAFMSDADFSAISPDPLSISKVLHRARMEVDEVGTKAAAVTAVVIERSSAPIDEPWTFRADKPFLCFIYDQEQELVLFATKVCHITQ